MSTEVEEMLAHELLEGILIQMQDRSVSSISLEVPVIVKDSLPKLALLTVTYDGLVPYQEQLH